MSFVFETEPVFSNESPEWEASSGNWLIDQCMNRTKRGYNNIILCVGRGGIGKTSMTTVLAEEKARRTRELGKIILDRGKPYEKQIDVSKVNFSAEKHILFDIVNFPELVQLPEDGGEPQGTVLVFDEGSIASNALDFSTLFARVITAIIESFRFRLVDIFVNAPSYLRVLIYLREMSLCVLKMKARGYAKVYMMDPTSFGKSYYYLIGYLGGWVYDEEEGWVLKRMPMPSDEVWTPYQQIKEAKYGLLIKNIMAQMRQEAPYYTTWYTPPETIGRKMAILQEGFPNGRSPTPYKAISREPTLSEYREYLKEYKKAVAKEWKKKFKDQGPYLTPTEAEEMGFVDHEPDYE